MSKIKQKNVKEYRKIMKNAENLEKHQKCRKTGKKLPKISKNRLKC